MTSDLTFSRRGVNFQFRKMDNGHIKWRSWDETWLSAEEASTDMIFIFSQDCGEVEKAIRLAINLPRFTESDKKKVIKWALGK